MLPGFRQGLSPAGLLAQGRGEEMALQYLFGVVIDPANTSPRKIDVSVLQEKGERNKTRPIIS